VLAELIQNELETFSASSVAEVVCYTILIAFIAGVLLSKLAKAPTFVSHTPALLTSLGIFGTFTGIVIGLIAFDETDIDKSITALLAGLETAFITSLFGILMSILFKGAQSLGFLNHKVKESEVAGVATPEDILHAITEQGIAIYKLVNAIGGEQDKSVTNQMSLIRSDINDNHKLAMADMKLRDEQFSRFSDKLWLQLKEFADTLSKSATETVIEALKQVIVDFNTNLTEQFGENFKQLNDAVKDLVKWQDNYKIQLDQMIEQYRLGVTAIEATETSVEKISVESKAIPIAMDNLKEVMQVNQHQLQELERHLSAFKDIRDRAVEAVPEIRKEIDKTVSAISDSVTVASQHYTKLLDESDKYIQEHIKASNTVLDNFVSKTSEGIDGIGAKLTESAKKVEAAITGGADAFSDNVGRTNENLQQTANSVSSSTEEIEKHLKDTVDDLNQNVRDMINGLVQDSKAISTTLNDANTSLIKDTNSSRELVTNSINQMQKQFEGAMENVYQAQTQQMGKVFTNLDIALREQVGKTGEKVEAQLSALDQAMQQELNRVMSEMGKALGQISNQFVKDYGALVSQMDTIVRRAS
jgi:uncharacterized protein YukE